MNADNVNPQQLHTATQSRLLSKRRALGSATTLQKERLVALCPRSRCRQGAHISRIRHRLFVAASAESFHKFFTATGKRGGEKRKLKRRSFLLLLRPEFITPRDVRLQSRALGFNIHATPAANHTTALGFPAAHATRGRKETTGGVP